MLFSKTVPAPLSMPCDLCRLDGVHKTATTRFIVAETPDEAETVASATEFPIEMSGLGVFWDACDEHASPGDIGDCDCFMPLYHSE